MMRSKCLRELCWSAAFLALAAAVIALGALVARGEEPQVVLLDFYADWCGPCQTMGATVERIASAGYPVRRVNIDCEPQLAARFHVERIPCFVAVAEGRELDRVDGPTSYERLRAMVDGQTSKASRRLIGPHAEREENKGGPSPAWRYERPVGHRSAVVRVYSVTATGGKSVGSGALVRWKKRVLILTAWHVVKEAKNVWIETHTKQTHRVKVLKADAVWDCAVLEPIDSIGEIQPVELERGQAAMQTAGNRLESCGYGPDGKLACNSGIFQGYRRSEKTPNGPDDWMVVSGAARSGDSGGPIFNTDGRVVGVLWGSDGENVVGVQAGRIHRLLEETVGGASKGEGGAEKEDDCKLQNANCRLKIGQLAPSCCLQPSSCRPSPLTTRPSTPHGAIVPTPGESVRATSILERRPTPAQGTTADQDCLRRLQAGRKTPPPGPAPVVQSDPEMHKVLADIDAKMGVLIDQRQPKPAEETSRDFSPLLGGLCILGAVIAGFVVYFTTQSKN